MEVQGEQETPSSCCGVVVQWLTWCSFCGTGPSYGQGFLEDGSGDSQGAQSRLPSPASASASSPIHDRQSLLPKATELRSSSSAWSEAKQPKWTVEAPTKQPKKDKMGDLVKGYPSGISIATSEEGETCPTCLEPYTPDNPAIWTKCNHQFHLACIYEWLERKQTCPICERPMCFEEVLE